MNSDNEIPSAPDNSRRRFRLSVLEKLLLIVIVIGLAMMFKVLLSSGAGIDPGLTRLWRSSSSKSVSSPAKSKASRHPREEGMRIVRTGRESPT